VSGPLVSHRHRVSSGNRSWDFVPRTRMGYSILVSGPGANTGESIVSATTAASTAATQPLAERKTPRHNAEAKEKSLLYGILLHRAAIVAFGVTLFIFENSNRMSRDVIDSKRNEIDGYCLQDGQTGPRIFRTSLLWQLMDDIILNYVLVLDRIVLYFFSFCRLKTKRRSFLFRNEQHK
jgi:hypothetical protein